VPMATIMPRERERVTLGEHRQPFHRSNSEQLEEAGETDPKYVRTPAGLACGASAVSNCQDLWMGAAPTQR
jgi:hypothetical protein